MGVFADGKTERDHPPKASHDALDDIVPKKEATTTTQNLSNHERILQANRAFSDYFNTACGSADYSSISLFDQEILDADSPKKQMARATQNLYNAIKALPAGTTLNFSPVSINRIHRSDLFEGESINEDIIHSRPLLIGAKQEDILKILKEEQNSLRPILYEAASMQGYLDGIWSLLQEGHYSSAMKYKKNLQKYLKNGYKNFDERVLTLNHTSKVQLLQILTTNSPQELHTNLSSFIQERYELLSPLSAPALNALEQSYSQISTNFLKLEKYAGDINTWDQRFANGGLLEGYWVLLKTMGGDRESLGEWKSNQPGNALAESVTNCGHAFDAFRRSHDELKKALIRYPNNSELIAQKTLDYQASFTNLQAFVFDTQTKAAHFEKTGAEYIMGWAGTLMDAALPFAAISLVSAAGKGIMFAAQSGTKAVWQTVKIALPKLAKTNLKIAAGFTIAETFGRLEEISTLQDAFDSFEQDKQKTIESMDMLLQMQKQAYLQSGLKSEQMGKMFEASTQSLQNLKNMKFEDVENLQISDITLAFAQVYAISFAFTAGHRFSKTFDMSRNWAKRFSATDSKQNSELFNSMLEQTQKASKKNPNAQGYKELESQIELYRRMSVEGKTIPIENFNELSAKTADFVYRANTFSPKEAVVKAKRRTGIKISARTAAKNRAKFDRALAQNRNANGIHEADPGLTNFLITVSENYTKSEANLFAKYLKSTDDFSISNMSRVVEVIGKNDRVQLKALKTEIKENEIKLNSEQSFTREISDQQIKDAVQKVKIHDNKNLINNVFESARNLQKESALKEDISQDIQILESNKNRAIELMGELDPQKMNTAVLRTQIEGYVEFANDYKSLKPLNGKDLSKLSDSELRALTSEIYNLAIKYKETDVSESFGQINIQANPQAFSPVELNSKILEMQQIANSSVEAAKRIEQATSDSPTRTGLVSQRQALEAGIGNMSELSGNLIFQTNISQGVSNTINSTYPNATTINDIGNPITVVFEPNYGVSAPYNQTLLDMSLREIIKNAAKYADTKIEVQIVTRNGVAKIRVTNDIRPGESPITPFQFENAISGVKNDNATAASTGKGIPLSNIIIERGLNGKINNASTSTQTIFEVELPVTNKRKIRNATMTPTLAPLSEVSIWMIKGPGLDLKQTPGYSRIEYNFIVSKKKPTPKQMKKIGLEITKDTEIIRADLPPEFSRQYARRYEKLSGWSGYIEFVVNPNKTASAEFYYPKSPAERNTPFYDVPGFGYVLEKRAAQDLMAKDGVTSFNSANQNMIDAMAMDGSTTPNSQMRIHQLEKANVPVNENVSPEQWLAGMDRGIQAATDKMANSQRPAPKPSNYRMGDLY